MDFESIDNQVHLIRVVCRKESIIVHVIVQMQTEMSTHKLHQQAKDACEEYQISLSTTETDVGHTKYIGIISGACENLLLLEITIKH